MRKNTAQQVRNLRLFEVGRVFVATEDGQQPEETEMLIGLWTGDREETSWYGRRRGCDFYDIKGVVEGLLAGLDVGPARFTGAPPDMCGYTVQGATASIQVENEIIGLVGELHPAVLDNYDLKQQAFVFELNLSQLYGYISDERQFRPISAYPATSRDVTLIVDRAVESRALLEHVQSLEEVLVEELRFLDVFDGDPIPTSRKSVSFRITYRSETETLADDRVNNIHRTLTEGLLETFDATFPT
jgi:phenylalanyl-tRNA synthetase beta chain